MRSPLRRALAATFLLGLLLAPGAALATPTTPTDSLAAPIPGEVLAAVGSGPTDVVVSYDPGPAAAELRRSSVGGPATKAALDLAASLLTEAKDAVLAPLGARVHVVRDFAHLPVQIVRVGSPAALEALAAEPDVTALSLPATYELEATNNLEAVRQPGAVAAGATGAGTAVAVLDTGLNPSYSPGLFGNCAGGAGTGTCRVAIHRNHDGSTAFSDADPERHGSNVTSVAATVAPDARILSYGVFFAQNGVLVSSTPEVLEALDHVLANGPGLGVRAVNLSLGQPNPKFTAPCGGSPFASTFSALRAAGIVPVVAAGNGAYASGGFQSGVPDPACTPGAVAVGAVYAADELGVVQWGLPVECTDTNPRFGQVPCFSQTGPLLSVLAPGVEVPGAGVNLSGTSQAAPHVAGAVAALFDANPSASLTDVVDAITSTGALISDTRTNPPTNRRLLDILGAVRTIQPANVQRYAGADRIATAISTSHASFPSPGSAGAVVLASSQSYPDGLAGTPLAVDKGAPLLLTDQSALRSDVLTEVQRVLPPNGTVYVLGGTGALGDPVATALGGAGYQVERLAGPDRYATAVAIADEVGSPSQVLLATGLNFPDALSAGVAAGHVGGIVLFTQGNTQAPATQSWLATHPLVPRVIVGGTATGTAAGATELVGADRFETATKVAVHFFGAPEQVGLASGVAFPDALSGGAHIARLGGPILLSNPGVLPAATTNWLRARRSTTVTVHVFGGTGALAADVDNQIRSTT